MRDPRLDRFARNLFVHRKPLPPVALDPHPDMYRLFIEQETSTVFLPAELKNGQEKMASEGVIAAFRQARLWPDTIVTEL